jgi:putative endonuclease
MTNPDRWYYFYIMASRSRNLYCGVTSDMFKRAWQHKHHRLRGFTARYNIDRLVYYELYSDIRSAIDREKQVKRWSRSKKLTLIESKKPTWIDLAAEWYGNADPSTRRCAPRSG